MSTQKERPRRMRMVTGLSCFLLIWILWLGAAFVLDSCWVLQRRHDAVKEIDRELMRHEEKLITLIQSTEKDTIQFNTAHEKYQTVTEDISIRHQSFADMVIAVGQESFDAGHPIERRYADEYAGALNRHHVAMQHYTSAAIEYNSIASGVRGTIAQYLTKLPESLPET